MPRWLKQRSVLGELLIGVLLGNLWLVGVSALDGLKHDRIVDVLAELGVILLLFEVGLESTVAQMLKVGLSSLLVASIGVVAPFVLGWGVSAWLLPEGSSYVHAFLGAALTATSVGITARVLKDLGRSDSDEARIILGAAVIDDVMGLIVLAVVSGAIAAANSGETLSPASVGLPLLKAVAFLVGALVLGTRLSPRAFRLVSRFKSNTTLLVVALSFCFALAWLAHAIGLAPIVGAFAAGLILEQAHYQDFVTHTQHELEDLVHPIVAVLSPIFFILMGMRTDLSTLSDPSVLPLAAALTLAAILGKQACYLATLGKPVDHLSIALGMIPRGEVGLIFANIGLALTLKGEPIISKSTYTAVVVMVLITTLLTPPALKWSLSRKNATGPEATPPSP